MLDNKAIGETVNTLRNAIDADDEKAAILAGLMLLSSTLQAIHNIAHSLEGLLIEAQMKR